MKKLFPFLFLLSVQLSAVTVHLNNDTMYSLEATVQDARGQTQVVITLLPDSMWDWSDTYGEQGYSGPFPPPPDQHIYSSTPFRVTWRCPSGDIFSVNSGISSGGMVQASQGLGNLSCKKSSSGTASSGAPAS